MVNGLSKAVIKLTTGLTPISVGTKFFPTDSMQNEYVELFNYTQTILFELEKADINSESIQSNLIRDIGGENIPKEFNFLAEALPTKSKFLTGKVHILLGISFKNKV